eukprot:7674958-Pyramimonas_sp.AAC.1
MRHAPSGARGKAGQAPRSDEAVASRPWPLRTRLARNSHGANGALSRSGTATPRHDHQGASRRARPNTAQDAQHTGLPQNHPTPEAREAPCGTGPQRETGRGKPKWLFT